MQRVCKAAQPGAILHAEHVDENLVSLVKIGRPAQRTAAAPGMQLAVHGLRYTGSSTARRDEHRHFGRTSPYRGGRVSRGVAAIGEGEQAKIREFVADDMQSPRVTVHPERLEKGRERVRLVSPRCVHNRLSIALHDIQAL